MTETQFKKSQRPASIMKTVDLIVAESGFPRASVYTWQRSGTMPKNPVRRAHYIAACKRLRLKVKL